MNSTFYAYWKSLSFYDGSPQSERSLRALDAKHALAPSAKQHTVAVPYGDFKTVVLKV